MVFTETVTLNASELDETHKRKRKEDNLNCLQDSIPLRIASLFFTPQSYPYCFIFIFYIYIQTVTQIVQIVRHVVGCKAQAQHNSPTVTDFMLWDVRHRHNITPPL